MPTAFFLLEYGMELAYVRDSTMRFDKWIVWNETDISSLAHAEIEEPDGS